MPMQEGVKTVPDNSARALTSQLMVDLSELQLGSRLRRRGIALAGALCAVLLGVAALPQLLGPEVRRAFAGLEQAQPVWLWFAAACFVAALAFNACAWRATVLLCGGRIGRLAALACYGIGSLVNAAVPARVGDAVRIALFSRAFDADERGERLWISGGVFSAIGAARALCLGSLVLVAAAAGALPLWPVLVLGGLVLAAAAAIFVARRRTAERAAAHVLDAFRALGREPGRGAWTVFWIALATTARLVGVAAIVSALGVHSPLMAAVIIVPALDVAGIVPLTPGNVGIASGTVAMALQARGIGLTEALTAAIALHAVETAASIGIGGAGILFLTRFRSPAARFRVVAVAGAAASIALVWAFSATVLVDLV
ncbi:MAG TPA: lysylphosphatidylglycerol synthase transmembrane domain-containing protein [Gaiellaceae bacterium]